MTSNETWSSVEYILRLPTAQKMKFSVKVFYGKCEQIGKFWTFITDKKTQRLLLDFLSKN